MISQTDTEFDDALEGLFEQAVDYLERNANHLNTLDEEAISAFLIAFLNIPGVKCITGDPFERSCRHYHRSGDFLTAPA